MRETIQQMIAIQEHDRIAQRLQREADSVPQRKKHLESSLSDHRKVLDESEEALKRGKAAAHEIEVEVGGIREKIQRLQRQQFEVKSNDDYRILTKEIHGCDEQIRTLEDRELEQMERNERLRERLSEEKSALADQEQAIREEFDGLDVRAGEITEEIKAMQEERRSLIESVDPAWLSRYERILAHVGDFALVPIESGTCGGCHMQLPPQVAQDARRAESISSCVYCGRLLYWR